MSQRMASARVEYAPPELVARSYSTYNANKEKNINKQLRHPSPLPTGIWFPVDIPRDVAKAGHGDLSTDIMAGLNQLGLVW